MILILVKAIIRNMVPELVDYLKEKKLLIESQGANVIDLSEYDMPPVYDYKKGMVVQIYHPVIYVQFCIVKKSTILINVYM